MTTRRKRGKPARWPWRSRLDVFLFFPLFFWRFSILLPQHPSTPAPFPPLISPAPFLALPLPRHSPQQHQLSSPPPLVFFFSFSGAFTTAEISRKDAQHTPAPSSAPTTTSSSASGPVDARLALLSLHGWTVSLYRILISGYLDGSGGKKWALA